MGNQREYIKGGGFSQYLYEDHKRFKPQTVNGIRGKAVHYIKDGETDHTGLPAYADTSDMYFRVGLDGKVVQAKLYIDRKHCIDFDWGHVDVNKGGDGKSFPKGVVHVQTYPVNENGKAMRLSHNARYMSNEEIAKYGGIIHAFNPDVKFRP